MQYVIHIRKLGYFDISGRDLTAEILARRKTISTDERYTGMSKVNSARRKSTRVSRNSTSGKDRAALAHS